MNSNFGLPMFYSNTRQGESARDVTRHNNENSALESSTPSGCGNGWAVEGAANSVGLIPRGNFGNSPEGGCGIDLQSDLLWGVPGTARTKGDKQTFSRPFMTTPFMGGGDPDGTLDENKLIFGHSTANRKNIQTVTDKQFPVFAPLLPEKEADIAENNYFVEPFLRVGLAARLVPHNRVDLTK